MNTVFISDLHLAENQPVIADIFLRFLQREARSAGSLYILGDFFEAWVGDDDLTAFHLVIIAALRAATESGLPIYLMHGNRDFLLGRRFLNATGCRLLPDEYVLNLVNGPVLLMHGDTLCTADTAYLKFRKKSRNWFMQKLFLCKSLAKRQAIAARMREQSKLHTSNAPEYLMDVTQAEVERVMAKHQVKKLIHGHTHRPAVHEFSLGDMAVTRTVLPAWHEKGNMLVVGADGLQESVDLY
ncbi:MAG: UDP-2,3-diacylglucosamine diphosphatase [Pseudomonadota bacterium]